MRHQRKLVKIPFTKQGFEDLKKQYEEILSSREDAVKTLAAARELGDLSENGLYKAARARLSGIDANLRRLHNLIKLADVVEKPTKGIVGIGSTVTVSDGKNKREFNIVGRFEANPAENKISDISPLGNALINKKEDETIEVNTPSGKINYKILKISP